MEKNVSTPGISIYFEAYLYSSGNYSSSSWQLPASSLLAPQRRPSMGEEEDENESPVEGQPEKVKKPKKVYCYISPKVSVQRLLVELGVVTIGKRERCFCDNLGEFNLDFYVNQQLSVKEFYLKIIPWRLFTFRVCPGTKVSGMYLSVSWKISIFNSFDKLPVILSSLCSLPIMVLIPFTSI